MTSYSVELRKTVPTYYQEVVEADSPEEAENKVLIAAGGIPADWEVIDVHEAADFRDHGGIMN